MYFIVGNYYEHGVLLWKSFLVNYKIEPASHDPMLTVTRAAITITTIHTLYSVCEIIFPKDCI